MLQIINKVARLEAVVLGSINSQQHLLPETFRDAGTACSNLLCLPALALI